MPDTTEVTYHVVCHDCRTESIERSREAARERADEHARSHDHSVEYDRIA